MYQFDESVNKILSSLIFEEAQDEDIDSEKGGGLWDKIKSYVQNSLKKRVENDPDKLEKEIKDGYEKPSDSLADDIAKALAKKIEESDEKEESEKTPTDEASSIIGSGLNKLKKGSGVVARNGLESATDAIVDNVSGVLDEHIPKSVLDKIDGLSKTPVGQIIAIFEPTGILSWGYLGTAKEEYDKHKGTDEEDAYALNLVAASLACIPGYKSVASVVGLPVRLARSAALGPIKGAKAASTAAKTIKTMLTGGSKALKAEKAAAEAAKVAKAAKAAKAAGVLGKAFKPVTKGGKIAASLGSKVAKGGAKITKAGAKISTALSQGDIKKTFDEYMRRGEQAIKNVEPAKPRIGTGWPSFMDLSTQRF